MFFWIPSAQVKLDLNSEPLVTNYKIKLNCNENKVLFNLNTIPAKLINKLSEQQIKNLSSDYRFINRLDGKDEIIVFRKSDLREILDYKIKNLIGENWRIVYPNKEYKIKILNEDKLNNQFLIEVFLDNEIVKKYDENLLKEKIHFKNLKDAKKYLQEIPEVKNVEIKIIPTVDNHLPFFISRIKIKFNP